VSAAQIADGKAAELKLRVREIHRLTPGSDSGEEKFPGRSFRWTRTVRPYVDAALKDETQLNQVDVRVEWKEGPRDNRLVVSSLILNQEKKQ